MSWGLTSQGSEKFPYVLRTLCLFPQKRELEPCLLAVVWGTLDGIAVMSLFQRLQ